MRSSLVFPLLFCISTLVAATENSLAERWNLADLYPSAEAW